MNPPGIRPPSPSSLAALHLRPFLKKRIHRRQFGLPASGADTGASDPDGHVVLMRLGLLLEGLLLHSLS